MKFLCLTYLDRGLAPGPDVVAQYQNVGLAMRDAGVFVDSGQLAPPSASKTVRSDAGAIIVTDGPPPDGSEHLTPSAYFLLDCANFDDAVEWVSRIPAVVYGSIEIRPQR